MLDNIIRKSDNDIELAIKAMQKEYKLRQGKTIMYMRKYAKDDDFSHFIEQIDNYIRAKLMQRIA